MADTFTPNFNLTKPEVGASTDTWGGKLNANMDAIDAALQATKSAANVTSGKFALGRLPDSVRPLASSTSSDDFNTLTAEGWQPHLYGTANANIPVSGHYFFVLNVCYSSNILQLAFPYTPAGTVAKGLFYRSLHSGTWTAWRNVLDKDTADTLYQPLSSVLTNTTASFTTALLTKLNGIAAGAQVNPPAQTQSTWDAGSSSTESTISPAKLKAAVAVHAPSPPEQTQTTWNAGSSGTESTISPAKLKAAVVAHIPTAIGAVGTYTDARVKTTVAIGATVAGSWFNVARSGTWRNMSDQSAETGGDARLFVRVS